MGPYEQLGLASFAAAGYRVSLFTYGRDRSGLLDVELCDARDILLEENVFEDVRRPGTFASYADRFRYRLLQVKETTWVDADVLKVGIPLPDGDYLMGYEDGTFVNNAILRAPKESQLVTILNETASAADPSSVPWGGLGPRLLTSVVKSLHLASEVQPPHVLYPVAYWEVHKLFSPRCREQVEDAIAAASTLHLWNEVMRTAGRDVKHSRPPRGSFLAKAFAEADIAFGDVPELDVHWVEREWGRRLESRRLQMLRWASGLSWSWKQRRN